MFVKWLKKQKGVGNDWCRGFSYGFLRLGEEREVKSPAWSWGCSWAGTEKMIQAGSCAQNTEGNPEEEGLSVTGSAVVLEETKDTEMLGRVQAEARRWQKMVHLQSSPRPTQNTNFLQDASSQCGLHSSQRRKCEGELEAQRVHISKNPGCPIRDSV